MRSRLFKLAAVSMPSAIVAILLAAAAVEGWTRMRWDATKGTPGFFLSDPSRRQRLAPGYSGWFAGVPVKINSLGLRDRREYALPKSADTIRVLVLGDSVAFGHGSVEEHTYPSLLEQRLRAWRPDVDWQVWNAAVPGYNTSQELAHLRHALWPDGSLDEHAKEIDTILGGDWSPICPYVIFVTEGAEAQPVGFVEVTLRFGADGKRLGISVSDPFGSLDPQRVLDYLSKCLRRGEDQIDRKEGGAGLGLYMMFDFVTHLVVNIQRGSRTEFVGLADITSSFRDLVGRAKSFNLFVEGRRA